MNSERKLLIFIPTYNEAENVEPLFNHIRKLNLDAQILFWTITRRMARVRSSIALRARIRTSIPFTVRANRVLAVRMRPAFVGRTSTDSRIW